MRSIQGQLPVFGVGSRVIDDDDLDTLNRGALYKRKEFLGVEEEGALTVAMKFNHSTYIICTERRLLNIQFYVN